MVEIVMGVVGLITLCAFLVFCGYVIILLISDEMYLLALFLFLLIAVMFLNRFVT